MADSRIGLLLLRLHVDQGVLTSELIEAMERQLEVQRHALRDVVDMYEAKLLEERNGKP